VRIPRREVKRRERQAQKLESRKKQRGRRIKEGTIANAQLAGNGLQNSLVIPLCLKDVHLAPDKISLIDVIVQGGGFVDANSIVGLVGQ